MSAPETPLPTTFTSVGGFAATRWTLVLRASGGAGEGRTALSELCGAYYQPVFAFLQRSGRGDDAARELTHEVFARLLARDPARGRFRNYLLGAVKYFLRDQHDLTLREKPGAGAAHEPIDATEEDAPALQVADPTALADDAHFDREWALASGV